MKYELIPLASAEDTGYLRRERSPKECSKNSANPRNCFEWFVDGSCMVWEVFASGVPKPIWPCTVSRFLSVHVYSGGFWKPSLVFIPLARNVFILSDSQIVLFWTAKYFIQRACVALQGAFFPFTKGKNRVCYEGTCCALRRTTFVCSWETLLVLCSDIAADMNSKDIRESNC